METYGKLHHWSPTCHGPYGPCHIHPKCHVKSLSWSWQWTSWRQPSRPDPVLPWLFSAVPRPMPPMPPMPLLSRGQRPPKKSLGGQNPLQQYQQFNVIHIIHEIYINYSHDIWLFINVNMTNSNDNKLLPVWDMSDSVMLPRWGLLGIVSPSSTGHSTPTWNVWNVTRDGNLPIEAIVWREM